MLFSNVRLKFYVLSNLTLLFFFTLFNCLLLFLDMDIVCFWQIILPIPSDKMAYGLQPNRFCALYNLRQ